MTIDSLRDEKFSTLNRLIIWILDILREENNRKYPLIVELSLIHRKLE